MQDIAVGHRGHDWRVGLLALYTTFLSTPRNADENIQWNGRIADFLESGKSGRW